MECIAELIKLLMWIYMVPELFFNNTLKNEDIQAYIYDFVS